MAPSVRAERPADGPAVDALVEAAFGRRAEADLVGRLRASPGYVADLALVAEDESGLVGHLMFTRVQVALDSGGTIDLLQLAPVAVLPDRQRLGIGGAMIREGLARAAGAPEPAVALIGHPDYYPRFGFRPASELGLRPPFDLPGPVFMAWTAPGRAPDLRGRLILPESFGGV